MTESWLMGAQEEPGTVVHHRQRPGIRNEPKMSHNSKKMEAPGQQRRDQCWKRTVSIPDEALLHHGAEEFGEPIRRHEAGKVTLHFTGDC